jgi:hypothetical protein
MDRFTDWEHVPLFLSLRELAQLYGKHPGTIERKLRAHDPSVPIPCQRKPWMFKKADVKRHAETMTIEGVRQARRRLKVAS